MSEEIRKKSELGEEELSEITGGNMPQGSETNVRIYKCPECGESFSQKSSRKVHMETFHKKK